MAWSESSSSPTTLALLLASASKLRRGVRGLRHARTYHPAPAHEPARRRRAAAPPARHARSARPTPAPSPRTSHHAPSRPPRAPAPARRTAPNRARPPDAAASRRACPYLASTSAGRRARIHSATRTWPVSSANASGGSSPGSGPSSSASVGDSASSAAELAEPDRLGQRGLPGRRRRSPEVPPRLTPAERAKSDPAVDALALVGRVEHGMPAAVLDRQPARGPGQLGARSRGRAPAAPPPSSRSPRPRRAG